MAPPTATDTLGQTDALERLHTEHLSGTHDGPTGSSFAAPDTAPTLSAREEAIAAIMHEAGCTKMKAEELYGYFDTAVTSMRTEGTDFFYLEGETHHAIHGLLTKIMPPHRRAQPGTAAAKCEEALLIGDELALVHSSRADACGMQLERIRG